MNRNRNLFGIRHLLAALLAACVLTTTACSGGKEPEQQEPLDVQLVVPAYVVEGIDLETDLSKEHPWLTVEFDETKKNYTLNNRNPNMTNC